MCVFFFKQKTAYEMRISDWSSDVCSSDLSLIFADAATGPHSPALVSQGRIAAVIAARPQERRAMLEEAAGISGLHVRRKDAEQKLRAAEANLMRLDEILSDMRSEEHTSELQSLMRISYAVFCLKKKNKNTKQKN